MNNGRGIILGALAATGMLVAGCEKPPQYQEVRAIQGTINDIDLKRRLITVSFFDKGSARTIELLARVPADCEVNIEGVLSSFERLRPGRMISAFSARVEHFSDADVYQLMKIMVDPAP